MNPFFLIFIGIPALEIFLLIKIGGEIGALSTVVLIFLTAVIGIYFAKYQGIQTLRSGVINLYQNKIPVPGNKKNDPPYSMDANLLHISYEGKVLEDPWPWIF